MIRASQIYTMEDLTRIAKNYFYDLHRHTSYYWYLF